MTKGFILFAAYRFCYNVGSDCLKECESQFGSWRGYGMSARKPPRTPNSKTKPAARKQRSTRAGSSRSLAQVSDDESRGGSSLGSGSTLSRDKLPRWLDKLFAQALESPQWACGIENVGEGKKWKLEKLLDAFQKDRKEEPVLPFGNRGDPIRRALIQKLTKWRALSEEKCLTKLGRLSVEKHQVSAWKSRNKVESDDEDDDCEGGQSLSSKSNQEEQKPRVVTTPTSSNKTRASRNRTEVPAFITTTSPTEALSNQLRDTRMSEPKMSELCSGAREKAKELGKLVCLSTVTNFCCLLSLMLLLVAGAIIKETADPLGKIRHGEVFACPILSHKFEEGGARWCCESGVAVEMPGDFLDHSDSKWFAQHVPGFENAILVTQPELPKSATSKASRKQHEGALGQGAKDGRDLAMTAFKDADDTAGPEFKLLIVFPPGMHLSNKPFHSTDFTDDDELDPDVDIDYDVTHIRQKTSWTEQVGDNERPVCTCQSWIRWQFVDLNTKKPLPKPSNKKKKGIANKKMGDLSKFDSMTLDDDDEGEQSMQMIILQL